MNFLIELWQAIAPYFAGVTISSIVSAIIFGCLKGAFNKTINKLNVEDIAEKATNKGVEKVKKISFEQSIQPIAESELKKITEQANEYMKDQLEEVKLYHENTLLVLEALAKYFDNSIGVPDDVKLALKKEIADAKTRAGIGISLKQEIKLEEVIEQSTKKPETAKIEPKTIEVKTKVER